MSPWRPMMEKQNIGKLSEMIRKGVIYLMYSKIVNLYLGMLLDVVIEEEERPNCYVYL